MAGHSKWANIKHKKQAQDAKRGKIFTKLTKEITISAKIGGGDENSNPRLRTAVLKARAANVPKDNIERAIKKGTGELEGINYEEILFEGYGPNGIAVIIETMTDKKSRTLPEIKNLFSKNGGSLAENGAVSYLFDHKGIIIVEAESEKEEEIFNKSIESGAEDFESDEGIFIIKTEKEMFHEVQKTLEPYFEENNISIIESSLQYIPGTYIDVDDDNKLESIADFIDILENHDDVQNVYTNINA